MSAIVKAVGGTISKASAGWDPIGNWIVNNDVTNAMKILQPIEKLSNKIDPLAPAVHQIEQIAGQSISNDPVLQWAAETTHDTGTSIDNGLKEVGINPDSLKMAIAGFFAPYAVPLLQAAMVKAKGGSWEDAAVGAAASYAAQYVGGMAGDWAGSFASGAPATAGQAATQYGISAGSQQAAQIAAQNAATMGFGDLAANQLVSQLTKAGVSSMTGQLISTGQVDINKVLDSMKSSGIVAGVPLLTSQIPGWNSLSKEAQSAINKTVAGTLQDKDPTAIGVSLAMDTALNGVKTYYNDALGAVKNTYGSAVNAFNSAVDNFYGTESAAQSTYNQLNSIKTDYDSKVAQYNNLVQQYNTSGDAGIKSQIDALKPQIESLSNQWTPLYDTYQNQLGNYNAQQTQLNAAMSGIIDSRREYYDTATKAINPSADMEAYVAFNKDVQDEIAATGKSASQIYLERQMANPNLDQTSTWVEGIYETDPSKVGNIASLYKSATGFDLNAGTGGIDPMAWSVYQDKVEGSADWYLAEAEKAKQAGDFTKYSQLMGELNKTYSGAFGESLGIGETDKQNISNKFVGSMLGSILQQKGGNATSGVWSPGSAPSTATTDPTKLITTFGFGNFNPYVQDLMNVNQGANMFLREKYTYDPTAVENRFKGITAMDLSNQPEDVRNTFKGSLQGAVSSGNYMFLPQELQQQISNQFSNVGTSGYNSSIGTINALDYLKSGAVGGLGSYFEAYANPYSAPTNAATGGLNQIASNWTGNSGITNPTAQSLLAKNLIS